MAGGTDHPFPPMRRSAVVGNAGTGKSALSQQLGRILGLEVVQLDQLQYQGSKTIMHWRSPREMRSFLARLDRS